jgi:putative sigma-54 modulation protein
MQIDISGHNIDLTEALKDYVKSKFEKLKRLDNNINHIHVVLSVNKLLHKAEATITSKNLFASSEKANMYESISDVVEKIKRRERKLKTKILNKRIKTPKNINL